MTNSKISDKIEAWLDGKLPDTEARAFEAEIETNRALAKDVNSHRLARQVLDRLAAMSLENDFKRWRETLDDLPKPPDDPPRPPVRLIWVYLMALLLILSAGAIWYFWPPAPEEQPVKTQQPPAADKNEEPIAQQTPTTPPELPKTPEIKQPVSPAPPRPSYNRELVALADAGLDMHRRAVSTQYGTVMGGDDDGDPIFAAGIKAYNEKNEQEAIRQLRQIPAGASYYASAQEILALLYFDTGNFPAAARAYEAFAAEFPSEEADWRLAQYYLATYDSRKADFWKKMDKILDPAAQHPDQLKAMELKKLLEEKGVKKE